MLDMGAICDLMSVKAIWSFWRPQSWLRLRQQLSEGFTCLCFALYGSRFLNTADQTLSVKSRTQSWRWPPREHIAYTSPRKRRRSSELPKQRLGRRRMTCSRWRRTEWPPPLRLLRLLRAASTAPGIVISLFITTDCIRVQNLLTCF